MEWNFIQNLSGKANFLNNYFYMDLAAYIYILYIAKTNIIIK